MVSLPTCIGEKFCTNYLPSPLFPKDTVNLYFEKMDPEEHHNVVTTKLWEHGKHQLQAYLRGQATLCIEARALTRFCFNGIIHEQTPQFEAGYGVRVHVLEYLLRMVKAETLVVTKEFTPYVFKLFPPSGILLDVTRNVARQKVQGIWIDDSEAYQSFLKEFMRLTDESACASNSALESRIKSAIDHLIRGEPYMCL